MKITPQSTHAELAAIVSEALAAHGISAVLTGGAAMSIYSENEFLSDDLDFVCNADMNRIRTAMETIGFRQEKGKYFAHPDTRIIVEFPRPPLMLGQQYVRESDVDDRQTPAGRLRILTPTQCVMDRLASFFHWNDYQGLLQALAVARRHPVDLEQLRRWSTAEGAMEKFAKFLSLLQQRER